MIRFTGRLAKPKQITAKSESRGHDLTICPDLMSGLVQINFFVDGRELVKCTLLHSREHWIPRHEVVTVSSRLLVPRRTDQFRVLRHATSQRRARDLHGRSSRYYDAPLPEVGGGGTWKATPPPGSPRRSASNAAKRTKQRTGIDQKERLGKLRGIEKGGLCTGWWPQPQSKVK